MKHLLTVVLGIIVSLKSFSREPVKSDSTQQKHTYSLGGRHWGIGIGKGTYRYTGIRVNPFDSGSEIKTNAGNTGAGYRTNGIELNGMNDAGSLGITNGLNLGVLFFDEFRTNGLAFSAISFALDEMNGFAFAGISMNVERQNGVAFTGLLQRSEKINGIAISGLDITSNDINGIAVSGLVCITDSTMNGIEISTLFSRAETVNGVIIGLVTKTGRTRGVQLGLINRARTMHGFQIGLINQIQQNPKWLRVLPIINFRFAKENPEKINKTAK